MIHPQLLEDCFELGTMTSGTLLLHRNAGVPWFILVPYTELADVLDLPTARLAAVTADSARVSAFIKEVIGCPKVNFAGLGNVVPQMHLHIIGRSEDDPCWPQPVWGNLVFQSSYESEEVTSWQRTLAQDYGLTIPQ